MYGCSQWISIWEFIYEDVGKSHIFNSPILTFLSYAAKPQLGFTLCVSILKG